jgi:hypothetical protein
VTPDATQRRWELDHGVTVTVAGAVPGASNRDGQPVPRVVLELPGDRASLLGYLIETVCMHLAALAPLFGQNRDVAILPAEQELADVLLEASNAYRQPGGPAAAAMAARPEAEPAGSES